MKRFSDWSQVVALSLFSQLTWSGPFLWGDYPIFSEAPLEAKLGTFSNGDSPDLLGVVLWSSGANSNHLEAIRIPPPYDGTGISSVTLESSASIFALGDICTEGNNVVVP